MGVSTCRPMDEGPSTDQGITISNSTFNGGCSKGMQILGGAYGVQVLNNEFAHLPDQDLRSHPHRRHPDLRWLAHAI